MTDSIYQIRALRHAYDGKTVLDIPALDISRGSILGISGANGSGKSTLLKLLAFSMPPTQGEIRLNGRTEEPMSPRVRSRVTLLTQTPYLLKRSVLDNVTYGLKIRKETEGLRERAFRALAAVGLDPENFSRRMWHQLSGGEAQRVAMAARIILRPQALLLDEPVASVDAASAALIRQASLSAREEWGCTLIIISHDLSWLHEISDTRITMDGGKIFSTGEESVIPGPYTQNGKEELIRPLKKGEVIRLCAPSPESVGATAVIPNNSLRLYPAVNPQGETNQITARITQMLLEKKTGRILTTLDMGGLTLSLSVTPLQASRLDLSPGKKTILAFNAHDVVWR